MSSVDIRKPTQATINELSHKSARYGSWVPLCPSHPLAAES